jgi:hypothetical protein
VPACYKCRDDGLIPTGRRAKEIDDRDLLLHRIPEPADISRAWVGAHECIIDDIITGIDLAMSLISGPIPDFPSSLSDLMGLAGVE